jgi:hypothetical protein
MKPLAVDIGAGVHVCLTDRNLAVFAADARAKRIIAYEWPDYLPPRRKGAKGRKVRTLPLSDLAEVSPLHHE